MTQISGFTYPLFTPPLPPSLLVDGNGDPFLESHRGQRLFSSSPCGPISSCLVGRTMAICFGGREFESHRGQRFFDPLSLAQKVSIFWGIIHHFNLPYSNHYICLSIRTIRDELQQRPNCMYHILVFIYTCITFRSPVCHIGDSGRATNKMANTNKYMALPFSQL